jgi:hypothetical protein
VAGFVGVEMPYIDKRRVDKDEYTDHAPCIKEQIMEFLLGGQGRVQKNIIKKMPCDLGDQQGDDKFNDSPYGGNNKILCIRPDISQKAKKISVFCIHSSISEIISVGRGLPYY